ncbi:hypothetical protein Fmac_018495 [Flemingia macrophylla]|uniref:RING-type E3 ubiquitin transferase n=1 Tax=Flemingia macrophylla TaxID=520843 RepID=A0ABD1M551_9FABA
MYLAGTRLNHSAKATLLGKEERGERREVRDGGGGSEDILVPRVRHERLPDAPSLPSPLPPLPHPLPGAHGLPSPPLPKRRRIPLFDLLFQDALLLLSPKPLPSLPSLSVTPSLLSALDPAGLVLCAVCRDHIRLLDQANQLPCTHLFHAHCITPWLHLHASCPLCRLRLHPPHHSPVSDLRSQLIARLSDLTDHDFYGLRTTLTHIASRLPLSQPPL